MKCSACANNECKGKYENRHKCCGRKEDIDCTCTCHESMAKSIFTKGLSIVGGLAATAGGIALTVATGGVAAVVAGAVIAGAGSSLAINPIQKTITGERMTLGDTAKDVALGATIGAITGPIGAGGGALARGASTAAKLGIRAAAGSVAGAASGAISETARAIDGEDVSAGSFAKSVLIGAAVGTVGGAAMHGASAASNKVNNEFAKAATRVAVQGGTAAATDASIQLVTKGEIDPKQLLLNTAGQVAVASTAEASSSAARTTKSYANRMNKELMKSNDLPKDKIGEFERIRKEIDKKYSIKLHKGKKIGNSDIHKLKNFKGGPQREGQIGATFGPKGENGKREGRIIFANYKGNPYYVDHTPTHDYDSCKPDLNRNDINNPLKGQLRPENLRIFDDDEEKKTKRE